MRAQKQAEAVQRNFAGFQRRPGICHGGGGGFFRGNRAGAACKFVAQGPEIPFREKFHAGGAVGRLRCVIVFGKFDRRKAFDAGEAAREQGEVAFLFQVFLLLSFQFIQMRIDAVERIIFCDQRLRGLLADAGDAGDVVACVPHQRQGVDHLVGADAEFLQNFRGPQQQIFPLGVDDFGFLRDQLQQIFVGGEDLALHARLLRLPRQRADEVIRLKSRQRQVFETEHRDHRLDVGHLRRQPLGHFRPVALVVGVFDMAECRLWPVEDHPDEIGLVILHRLAQAAGQAIERARFPPVRRGQTPHREMGTEQQRRTVNQQIFSSHGRRLSPLRSCANAQVFFNAEDAEGAEED